MFSRNNIIDIALFLLQFQNETAKFTPFTPTTTFGKIEYQLNHPFRALFISCKFLYNQFSKYKLAEYQFKLHDSKIFLNLEEKKDKLLFFGNPDHQKLQ